MVHRSFLLLFSSSLFFSVFQADATHDRVVKREDGEKLAKVLLSRFLSLFAGGCLS